MSAINKTHWNFRSASKKLLVAGPEEHIKADLDFTQFIGERGIARSSKFVLRR